MQMPSHEFETIGLIQLDDNDNDNPNADNDNKLCLGISVDNCSWSIFQYQNSQNGKLGNTPFERSNEINNKISWDFSSKHNIQ